MNNDVLLALVSKWRADAEKLRTLAGVAQQRGDMYEADARSERASEAEGYAAALEAALVRQPAVGDGMAHGVNACIAWVEKRRHDFESEYGRVDPSTNAMEFGNSAREEYDAELVEIEEGLRALLAAQEADRG